MRARPPPLLARTLPLLAALVVAGCDGEVEGEPSPLKVVSTVPANGEEGVLPDVVLRVEFDDELDPRTVKSGLVKLTPEAQGGISVSGKALLFTPYEPLKADTPYLAEVMRGLRGMNGGTLAATHGIRFTTRGSTTDVRPPAQVLDLSIEQLSGTSVKLTWTATGDDGLTGTATRYDLRWGRDDACPLDGSAAWDAATPLPLPAPLAPGTVETATLPNLPRKALVCFALQVVDDFGNRSALSNSVSLQLPDLVPPNAPVLDAGTVGEDFVQLRWTAVGDDGDEGTAREYRVFMQQGLPCTLTPETAGLEVDGGTATELAIPPPADPGTPEKYLVDRLTRDTDYCFLLRVRDTGWNATFSNVLGRHTPDNTPPAEPVLRADAGLTDVQLEWTTPGDDDFDGTLSRQSLEHMAGRCPIPGDPFSGTATPTSRLLDGGTPDTESISGLQPDTDHCYRLVVEDNAGHVVPSAPVEVHTLDPAPPGAPVLQLDQVASDSVVVSWVTTGDNGTEGQGWWEELWLAQGADCATFSAANLANASRTLRHVPPLPGTPQSYTAGRLTPDEDVCALLVITDETGKSASSNVVTFHTLDEQPPGAPTLSLDAQQVTASSLSLRWTAPGDNGPNGTASAQSLVTWSSTGPCAAEPPPGATTLQLPPPAAAMTQESRTVTGLAEDTTYCFQLTVADEVGNTATTNVVTAKTLDVTPPATPVLVVDLLANGLFLEWDAVGDNGTSGLPTGYELRYREAAPGATPCPTSPVGGEQELVGDTSRPLQQQLVTVVAGKARYRVDLPALAHSTTYCAQVSASDEVGHVSRSAVVMETTDSRDVIPPDAPGTLRVVRYAGIDTLQLSWFAPGDDGANGTVAAYQGYLASGADCVLPQDGPGFALGAASVKTLPLQLTPLSSGSLQETSTALADLYKLGATCVRLRATDDVGNASPLSNQAFPPAPVENLTATSPGEGKVDLRWSAVGATHLSGSADAYQLHVRSGANVTCPQDALSLLQLPDEPSYGQQVPLHPAPAGTVAPEGAQLTQLGADQPLCVALEVINAQGDRSFSNVVSVTVLDDVPPGPFQLSYLGSTTTTADFSWTETWDNGGDAASGPAEEYRLGWVEVPAPVNEGDDPCVLSIDFGGALTAPAGYALTLSDLTPATWYCVQMQALDEKSLAGFSNVVSFRTEAVQGDGDPPARPTLAALMPGDVRSLSDSAPEADLSWRAVAEDGQVPGTEIAADHVVLYRDALPDGTPVSSAVQCAALNAQQDAAQRKLAEDSAWRVVLPTQSGPQVGDEIFAPAVSFSRAAPEQPLCVAVRAVDASGLGTTSAWIYVRDNTAPAMPANLRAVAVQPGQVTFAVTAPGDDDTFGAAKTYQLSHVAGACADVSSTYDTLAIQAHDVSTVVPGAAGNEDTLSAAGGLQPESTYCFRLRALDDAGNGSPYAFATVTLPSAAAFELQALRDAVASGTSATGLSVSGATVSYDKPDLSAGRSGAGVLDTTGGFFLQAGRGTAAIFAAMPGHGLQPGERVDLADVTVERLSAAGAPDPDGMVVITSANITKLASPGACSTCADGFTCEPSGRCNVEPLGVSALSLQELQGLEHQRVTADVLLTGAATVANGFATFPVATVGTGQAPGLTLQLPAELATLRQLEPGMALTVTGTPLWREGTAPQLAAWRAEDLEVPTRVRLESPAAGSTNVPLSLGAVEVKMNHLPLVPPPTGPAPQDPAEPLRCDPDFVELSADGFRTCVAATVQQDPQDGTRLVLTPVSALDAGRRYHVRLPNAVTGDGPLVSPGSFVTVPASTCTPSTLVISQFVTDTGPDSPFSSGFVELHNRSGVEVDLAPLKLELAVAPADASSWTFLPLTGTVPAGGYRTVTLTTLSLPADGAVAAVVPEDADGDGVNNWAEVAVETNPFDARVPGDPGYEPTGCPGASALDVVGFGERLREGCSLGFPAPSPASGHGLVRRAEGCVDHGDNAGDFDETVAQQGRSPMSPPNGCYCGTSNVTDTSVSEEADYCVVQHPPSWHDSAGSTFTAYGQVYEAGVTEPFGASPSVRAEFGLARDGTPLQGWSFRPAAHNAGANAGNNDEYQLTLTVPPAPGETWRYLFRVSLDQGASWTYCDVDGAGSDNGLSFSVQGVGTLAICSAETQPDGSHAACVP